MRLNDYYITEKLDLNVPIKIAANNAFTWQATFEVDGEKYQFVADLDDTDDEGSWGVTFWDMSISGTFTRGSTRITGKMGTKALPVFSGVASAFKKFIKQRKPDNFFFSAEEPSRVKLYNRLAKMLAQKFNYKLDSEKQDGDSFYDFIRN